MCLVSAGSRHFAGIDACLTPDAFFQQLLATTFESAVQFGDQPKRRG